LKNVKKLRKEGEDTQKRKRGNEMKRLRKRKRAEMVRRIS
jgi:hypothetical protein